MIANRNVDTTDTLSISCTKTIFQFSSLSPLGESPLSLLRNFSATAFVYWLTEPKLGERRLVELSGIEDFAAYPLEAIVIYG